MIENNPTVPEAPSCLAGEGFLLIIRKAEFDGLCP